MPGGIEPSNLAKPFWPDDGLTKGDLLDYFDRMAPLILPELRDRPLTVIRYPDGAGGPGFYQKETPKYAPSWVRTLTLPSGGKRGEVRYTVCNSKRTLMWLANQASIELHPWLSRLDRLERPTHVVLDIDPPEGDFDRAVQAALLTRDVLADAGLHGVAKTSGSKGIHVYVPVPRRYDGDELTRAARRLAARAEEMEPDLVTVEFRKAARGGRVFLDWTRIGAGKHVAVVYSPRARPGATVSFPVAWSHLDGVSPQAFSIKTVPRLVGAGDPWRELMPAPQRLPLSLTKA
jgi:DNA ligase D